MTSFSFTICGKRRKDMTCLLPGQDWKRNDMHFIQESRENITDFVTVPSKSILMLVLVHCICTQQLEYVKTGHVATCERSLLMCL